MPLDDLEADSFDESDEEYGQEDEERLSATERFKKRRLNFFRRNALIAETLTKTLNQLFFELPVGSKHDLIDIKHFHIVRRIAGRAAAWYGETAEELKKGSKEVMEEDLKFLEDKQAACEDINKQALEKYIYYKKLKRAAEKNGFSGDKLSDTIDEMIALTEPLFDICFGWLADTVVFAKGIKRSRLGGVEEFLAVPPA